MIKVLDNVELEATHFNIIKTIYEKCTANVILNGEKLETILLKSGMRWSCLLCPLLFNSVPEALVGAITQEKELKELKQEKKKSTYLN